MCSCVYVFDVRLETRAKFECGAHAGHEHTCAHVCLCVACVWEHECTSVHVFMRVTCVCARVRLCTCVYSCGARVGV